MLDVCSAHVPCEALRRKTRTSDAKRPRRHSEELEAGPRVAIILVFNIAALVLIYIFLTRASLGWDIMSNRRQSFRKAHELDMIPHHPNDERQCPTIPATLTYHDSSLIIPFMLLIRDNHKGVG